MQAKNLIGEKFGKLTVISRFQENTKSGRAQWVCRCDCGNTTIVPTYRLTCGETKSCGCKRYESHNKVHGMTKTDIHNKWLQIKQRCLDKNYKAYQNYGAVGITICDEWKDDFVAFMNWSYKNGYREGLSLDRIDNSKGYSPDNCRWVTWKDQCNNRRSNINVTYQGRTQTLKQWCEELNLNYDLIRNRMRKKRITFEEAIEEGVPAARNHYKDIDKKLVEENGLKYKTVWMRINACGWDEEKALTTPVHHSRSYHPKPLSRPDKNNTHPSPNGLGSKDKP